MIDVISVYEDCQYATNKTEGGYLSISEFNKLSRRAELRTMDYLTGDINGQTLPIPYATQKNVDWVNPLITPYKKNIVEGMIDLPSDYYGFDEQDKLGGFKKNDDGDKIKVDNTPVEILSSSKFAYRSTTYIKSLKPSAKKPICKVQGRKMIFNPIDLGSVQLMYIRYPKFAKITSKIDGVYNDEVPDDTLSVNYEYDEWARELLIFFISDFFANHTREKALKETNLITNKSVRG